MGRKRIDQSAFKIFIGNWKTEGEILKTGENSEMAISGVDTYEAVLDGFFILHKADVLLGSAKSQTLELMWLEESDEGVTLQHYNNSGDSGVMHGTLKNGVWKIDGKELRFEGQFNKAFNELTGQWQRFTPEQKWVNFMKIKLNKMPKA